MEAVELFEVIAAVTWDDLRLDPGEIVSIEQVGNRLDALLSFGAIAPVPAEVPAVAASFGHLV